MSERQAARESLGAAELLPYASVWVAVAALATKEGLFRYVMAVAQKGRSSLLVINAWPEYPS